MAVAEPSMFKLNDAGWVSSIACDSFAVCSLTAVAAYFYNEPFGIRQICVKPFIHSWPRFTAVVGEILGTDGIHFNFWRGGVVFGTASWDFRGQNVWHSKGCVSAPIYGSMLSVHDESRQLSFLR